MGEVAEDRYMVDVFAVPKAVPVAKASLDSLKGVVGGKGLARMRREAVDCPVKGRVVSFVECFTCDNFNRRVKGKVGCRGLPLPNPESAPQG